ncbi:MAG: 16S rRNA (cytosine(967)-C(5))-methyltransferase RsmB [Candidatus Hinthialibacter antarcticus]|nr:16S rRNA (cytosine(967)-C(5))-methyltransferase RsmB [Candidatus Hinthialibacter antarcticus]
MSKTSQPSPARSAALQLLDACLTHDETMMDALDEIEDPDIDKRDAALAREIALGTCRRLGAVRFAIRRLAKNFENFPGAVQRILELSAYQLLFLDRTPAYAVVSDAVELTRAAKCGGLSKAVNGILRNLDRQKDEIEFPQPTPDLQSYLSITESHPAWLIEQWRAQLGESKTRELCEYNNTRAPLSLRLRDREAALKALDKLGVAYSLDERFGDRVEIESNPDASLFDETFWTAQDGAAQLAAACVGAAPGMRIWDVCSAPGGKTFYMADRLKNEGKIIAGDRSRRRLSRLTRLQAHLGLHCVETHLLDVLSKPVKFDEPFDAVLLDAPCTGWGAFRRRPDLRWRLHPADAQRLAETSLEMMERACVAVKKGGVLVYSTCTLSREENAGVVQTFLQRHPQFERDSVAPFLPPAFETAVNPDGALELFPPQWGLDGAFAARLKKKA